jgi:hypothetical protein
MSYMNINKIENEDDGYRVDYVANHTPHDIIVDGRTAQLLEHAKEAGASERMREIRKLLELSW